MATIVGSLSFTGEDSLGVPTNYNQDFSFDDAKTAANISTFANDAFDHFTPTSDAAWTKIAVTLYPVVNNPTTALGGSEAERVGLFNLSQASGRFKYGVPTESIAQTLITNGKIDLSASAVTNWIAYLTAAHSGFTLISKAALALVALIDALISFRKKRKLEERRSFEIP